MARRPTKGEEGAEKKNERRYGAVQRHCVPCSRRGDEARNPRFLTHPFILLEFRIHLTPNARN